MFRASRCACDLLRSLTFGEAVWWIKILAGRRLCTFRLRADRAPQSSQPMIDGVSSAQA
jgi:hypothetical protein